MATNPVFNRIDKETQGYAGFGNAPQQSQNPQQHPGYAPQGGPQQGAPMGYPGPSETMSPQQLEQMYQQPPAGPAQTGRLTIDDVVMKSMMIFGIVLAFAAGSWFVVGAQPELGMPIWMLGMFGSLGLSFAIAFKKTVSVPLIVVHAVLQGLFLGAVSVTFNSLYNGVVTTAVVATMATAAGMFLAWKIGFIKVTSKSRRIFGMAAMGYLVFLLVNLGASFMGFGDGWGLFGSQFGWLISILGVGLASYSLAVDFDSIDRGVKAGAPEQYSWLMGHGLIASLVWLYIEFLRLFAILQSD
ncbi:Bax inhibitor-1/YccA family membrane protein [Ornithinicoccus hortensis]|uniref:Putative YccA/Bax inhibitor family protein n=1 Tax=Ornithinicoccus hortensis TaxID=82346 RepID=A0A542YVT1_9MICO|nr:Bax inhibitor-1/YccA family protein [Ornithinicoccus hortensis]TQL52074.1 putative YccA/Bax inhibitor family protein [Ornithinicoccus hortensis]